MSRQKSAERKFNAHRRLAHGGSKITPQSKHKDNSSIEPLPSENQPPVLLQGNYHQLEDEPEDSRAEGQPPEQPGLKLDEDDCLAPGEDDQIVGEESGPAAVEGVLTISL